MRKDFWGAGKIPARFFVHVQAHAEVAEDFDVRPDLPAGHQERFYDHVAGVADAVQGRGNFGPGDVTVTEGYFEVDPGLFELTCVVGKPAAAAALQLSWSAYRRPVLRSRYEVLRR